MICANATTLATCSKDSQNCVYQSATSACNNTCVPNGNAASCSSLPTVASVQALCTAAGSAYQAGTAEFTPPQFCVLFEGICSGEIIAGVYGSSESACETAYAAVPNTSAAGWCRTEHLCNANQNNQVAVMPHCYHAQGWGSATSTAGSPCQ
jgi:hypothetical protein